MPTFITICAAYLLGSLSFAVISSRAFNLPDPRTYGSSNPGATNVLRSGHKLAAIVTLLGDGLKGWLAVWLAVHFQQQAGLTDTQIAGVMVAVTVGHMWPVFFRFKGGKGVATALGILLAINAVLGLACLATWLAAVKLSKISSLGALLAALAAPIYAYFLLHSPALWVATVIISSLLLVRHHRNIRDLIKGQEAHFKSPTTSNPETKTPTM